MENFSILTFLQNMLKPREENGQNGAEETGFTEEKRTDEKPPESPVFQGEENGQRAVLQFMEEHERRAKRIRKP
jgi:hypothetical protein